jgi:hypothetical protein
MIIVILAPIVVYWSYQRITEHARWDNELHYAQLFNINVDTAADSIEGTFYPWNNQSQMSAQNALSQAELTVRYLGILDSSHVNELDMIALKIHGSSSAFNQITQPQRVSFSTNLRALGIKIVIAYVLNNTSTTYGVGPSFWYTGPSPPNEQDLQDASTIAANLTG